MTDAKLIEDLIEAFRRSKCMFTAAQLGVFDRTPATLAALASDIGADPDALERLLCGCVSLGLLAREGDRFVNTAAAHKYLRRDSPDTMLGYILYSDRVLYPMWGNLADAVKEGANRWKQTFDLDGPIFAHFFQTPESRAEFLLGMHGFGVISSPAVVRAFDLSRFQRFVDLGGATGHLALAAVEAYAGMSAAVFDLPAVVEHARNFVGDHIDRIGGDFFTDPLPSADLYGLGRILHDWSEPKIRTLLRRIYDALPAGGALLIAERLLQEDKSGPTGALMQSLNMLVCTEGKERTLGEYAALLYDAGFTHVDGKWTGAPLDAILACKS
ncbi:MAG: homocysteine methyltransferase [Bryobacterales bacterium]|nr:homocysteine methyltransferase [Bryobacterales bacterium]